MDKLILFIVSYTKSLSIFTNVSAAGRYWCSSSGLKVISSLSYSARGLPSNTFFQTPAKDWKTKAKQASENLQSFDSIQGGK
jgi:hypothetical protein